MKKLIISFCLLCVSMLAHAQFEQGKWIVNPSLTGLNFSHSNKESNKFGLNAQVGTFAADNFAVLVTLGGDWEKNLDIYHLGAGGRYYLESCGIFFGAGGKIKHWKPKHEGSVTDYALSGEMGYAFFLSRTITVEPSVYYDLSLKSSDYSKVGIKVGFGFYF